MASMEAMDRAIGDLKTQWSPSFSSQRFSELVLQRLRPLSDAQVRRLTDRMLDNCDAGKLRISDITSAVRYIRDSEPPEPLAFFQGEPTFRCPRCRDTGLQVVLVESRSSFAGQLFEYVEPCEGFEGRECAAGAERLRQLSRLHDSDRFRVLDRFAIDDGAGLAVARAALAVSAVPDSAV